MRLSITHLPLVFLCSSLILHPSSLLAEEPPVIAPTNALSPADERKAFTVPAGFDVQLVASEPDIQKPIQMAFDAKGRLWVTTSYHYPFAAPAGTKPSDKLYILSDFDPATGKAKKVEIFADDLNIPIGILPLPDCKSCIVSSVGEIRKYTDTKGTGKADKMEVLFTGFGVRDTHGMNNSYTYMPDGWVYACHGYLNTSRLKGKDGHEVEMNSGNTFRFRPDGSRIEVYTRGQVNPFGIAVDPWFNLYTADCHSKPITQLIPGGYYDSFGKPHDGLGYAPHVVHHDHGSTALCGLTWYDADHFPKEYKGTMFLGNVVTSRINFDRIDWKGATPVGIEQPDFLVSKDPWFRPVDIKLGPDGALYVSDFYNKIIGHYEVDLRHPQRDKDRGRVWRIVWKGKDGTVPNPKAHRADFTAATDEELSSDLLDPNLTVRFLAGHQLRKRSAEGVLDTNAVGKNESKLLQSKDRVTSVMGWGVSIFEAGKEPLKAGHYAVMVDWALKDMQEHKLLKPEWIGGQFVKVMSNRPDWGQDERKIILNLLKSFDSVHLRFACVEAVTFHPSAEFVQPLIEVLKKCPAEDTHLRQAARIALRNCLRDDDKAWPPFNNVDVLRKGFDPIYTEMAVAIPKPIAAQYLAALLNANQVAQDRLAVVCEHIARNGSDLEWMRAVWWLTSRVDFTPDIASGLQGLLRALQSRGIKLDDTQRQQILEKIHRELGDRLIEKEQYTPETVKRWTTVTKLLAALPALMGSWEENKLDRGVISSLEMVLKNKWSPVELRSSTADALMRAAPKSGFPMVKLVAADPQTPPSLREQLLIAMAGSAVKDARLDARDSLKDVPYRLAISVGTALASSPAGAEDLLDAVKQGKAPARLLQERVIVERLKGANVPNLDKKIAELTKDLPAADARLADLMKVRAARYGSAKTDKELGIKLFAKHCGACHRIADQGGKFAPQLDGIGVRGLERLLEDVLDPNRNVDQAFRARVITTKDERTITGLMLRVEGEVLIVVDGEGKEIRIPTKDIDKNRETMLSPMPANFGDVIPEADFYHLMAYLLDQKAKEPPKK
jgi:putative heme-binding domain-containing protein